MAFSKNYFAQPSEHADEELFSVYLGSVRSNA